MFGQSVTMTINGAYADQSGNSNKVQGLDTVDLKNHVAIGVLSSIYSNYPVTYNAGNISIGYADADGNDGVLSSSAFYNFNDGASLWQRCQNNQNAIYRNNRVVIGGGINDLGIRLFVLDTVTSGLVAGFQNKGNAVGANGIKIQAGTDAGSTATQYIQFYDNDGTLLGSIKWNGTTGSGSNLLFAVQSDLRLKQNIHKTIFSIDTLMKINIVDFNWRDKPKGKIQTGMIAQELYKVYPNAVIKPEDETKDVWTLNQDALFPLMIKSIQDQQAEISDLTKRIEALEKR